MPGIDDATGVQYVSGGAFYDHILNDMFLPAVADTVINPNELLKLLPRDKTRVQGKHVVYPIHIGRNIGGNAISPGGDLPDPGVQAYDGYSFPIRHNYQRILFDGISMDASKSDVASWLRVVESEVKGATMDMARRRNRQFNNDGSGRIAEVNAVAGTTITLEINQGIVQPGSVPTTDFAPTKFVQLGTTQNPGRLAFATSAFGTPVVDSLDPATPLTTTDVEVVSGAGIAVGDWVFEASNTTSPPAQADTAYQAEPMGIAGIFSDVDPDDGVNGFQGIFSATGDGFNQANILDNGGTARTLTERLLQRGFSDAIEIGEASVDCMFSAFGVMNTYIDLLISDKRFVNTTNLPGGATVVTFNGIPWIVDRDAYSNRVYYVDKGNLRVYVMADPQWMNFDGSSYSRLANKDAYQATLLCRETLGVDVRDKCTLLVDLIQV